MPNGQVIDPLSIHPVYSSSFSSFPITDLDLLSYPIELVFLYIHYDEFDNAALTMLNHPADAWEHPIFKDVIPKVANTDICYKAVQYYLTEQPLLVNDLMTSLLARVDHTRVVGLARRLNNLPLVKPYLVSVQEVTYYLYIRRFLKKD